MKILILLLIGFTQLLLSAELTHVTIGNQDFSIVKETYDIYGSKGEVMKFYKEERNNDLTFVLRLTMKDHTGSCSDKGIQEGSYEINGTTVTLYSFWERRGKAYDAPYGARITQYEMLDDHTVIKKLSHIYIESERKNYNDESGMKYLFTPPTTHQQKEELRSYIEDMERQFKGTFVYGNEAKNLKAEVKKALSRKMKRLWESE
ncbi:hypothetical protein [Sulfurovum sp.]|uniref:hypothetical protein n=1 Tax=Sulfurovum sp. TaxID=1969726 RepID=UPI0028682985|nr:hypothetical protein [Sulfurovum sp.]